MSERSEARTRMSIRLPRTPKGIGVVVLAVLLVFAYYAFNQQKILTSLSSGQDLKSDFVRDYQVLPYKTIVKVAGVQVGTVTGTSQAPGDHTIVDMKLTGGTLAKLGTAPRAIIRPTTLLGGKYYVELVRAGAEGAPAEGSTIPLSRTAVPVELDDILSTVTPKQATQGIQNTISSLAATLDKGGRIQLQSFLDAAPQTLKPLTAVLTGAEGTHPDSDLTGIVSGLQATAQALTQQQGQIGSIISGMDQTVAALDHVRAPLAATFAQGASTLHATEMGLADLGPTLDQLRTTATNFTPSAQQLSDVLDALDPVLREARPVVVQLKSVATSARPLVRDAVPTVKSARTVLNDARGPVLKRLNGPIAKAVLTPWVGTGLFKGSGDNGHPTYKEAGYLLANMADVFKYHDHNQAMGRLMAGVSLESAGGIVQMGLPQYLASLGVGQLGSVASALTSPLASATAGTKVSTGTSSKSPLKSVLPPLSSLLGGLL
jgi:phospholipid/cholesterol/gamma-HCH transport system substrate-binding protein